MASVAAPLLLGSLGANWTKIMLIAIFAVGLVAVVLVPLTIDIVNAHKSWRAAIAANNTDALSLLKGPTGIQGLARSTIAVGLLVAIGFGLGYVLVEHPFADNKTIVTTILTALTTAFASVAAFYFSARATQGATEAAVAATTTALTATGTGTSTTAAAQQLAVTVKTPTDGQTFAQNEAVNADYSVSPSSGAQITLLKGTVDSGSRLDTSTIGEFPFQVTAKDSAGQKQDVSYTYTVQATPPAPNP
jgi:hypothetical protein